MLNKKNIDHSKFETGIYNYCDRWCEKCKKTKKCMVYYNEQVDKLEMQKNGLDPDDLKNVLSAVSKRLSQTMEMILSDCKKRGIDLTLTAKEEDDYKKRKQKTIINNEYLYKLSQSFYKKMIEWFESVPSLDIVEYREAYQWLGWHGTIISAKIYRALSSKIESEFEADDFLLQDSKKSALVAYRSTMISIESLKLMDTYVVDARISEMIELLEIAKKRINSQLLG